MNFVLRRVWSSIVASGFAGLMFVYLSAAARAECPFCSAVSQTLRQEMDQTEVVALARIVPGSETESDAEFEVHDLLSGANFAREGQRFRVNYFGKAKEEQLFLLMGIDPPDLLWSSPLPLTPEAIAYISAISSLPKEPVERLKFYLQYLENPDNIISRDAYDEFASAPYADIIALKEHIDRPQLLQWIQKTDITAERRRLYLVMLGVVGKPEDAELLEEMLRSDDPNRRTGLDALIACYATLKGEKGLDLIDELFLANKQSQYADTYSAIMALRFHGTEGGVIDRERVQESMRLLLNRPELADLVIPDLARWEDWSQIDKVVELFKGADEKTSWVRVPVINYLRACPLPAAQEHLNALKEIDPAAYKRAVSFFPVPKATPSSTDGSSLVAPELKGRQFAFVGGGALLAFGGDLSGLQGSAAGSAPNMAAGAGTSVNRSTVVGVLGMVSITCWLAMWLSISGAGHPGSVAASLGSLKCPILIGNLWLAGYFFHSGFMDMSTSTTTHVGSDSSKRELGGVFSDSQTSLSETAKPIIHGGSEGAEVYRSVSRAAILSCVFGVLGLVAFTTPWLLPISVGGAIAAVAAFAAFRRYPDELVGKPAAVSGLVLCALTLVGAPAYHIYVYATEVPEGYMRISFDSLMTQKGQPELPTQQSLELDGQQVFIKGYIHPSSMDSLMSKRFVIVPDLGTCCFGGQPPLTHMIEVSLAGDQFAQKSLRKQRLAGTLHVNRNLKPVDELTGVFYTLRADILK